MSNNKFKKVKITKANAGSWYVNCIGEEVDVYEYDGDFFLLDELDPYSPGVGRYISKKDCYVVPLSQPVPAPKVDDKDFGMDIGNGQDRTAYLKWDKGSLTPISKEEYDKASATPKPPQEGKPGEVPDEVEEWIGDASVNNFGLHTPKNAYFRDGALAIYHRDRAEINQLIQDKEALRIERNEIRQRWEDAQKNITILTDDCSKKANALKEIINACQHIKDNPNVAYILKIAEEANK